MRRILRIGIIQGGRIVEERLVRRRETVTIGQSAKNLFVVPTELLPRSWPIFEITPKGYVAHFTDGMDARIAVANEIISLAQLKQSGKIRRHGQGWVMLLDERSRGKITVGDTTILFQFVTPPPPAPRPQLPPSVRGSFTKDLDWGFATIAIASFLAHLILAIYLRSVDWPRKPDIEEIPDRFVQMVMKKPEPVNVEKPVEAKEEGKEEKKPDKSAAEKKPAPKKEVSAEEKARIDAERRARLAEQVRNTGILKLLGAKADGAGSIADVLGKGDVDRDQAKAFEGVGGLSVATADSALRGVKTGTGGTGKVANIAGLRGGGSIAGANTGDVGPERAVKAVVKHEAPAVDGELDPNIVTKMVRERMSAIRGCYERVLKRNPNISGKLVIRWTIAPAGNVTGVDVDQDTLGDGEVANCIKSLIKNWRFPAPSGGAVEVSFPFVFQATH